MPFPPPRRRCCPRVPAPSSCRAWHRLLVACHRLAEAGSGEVLLLERDRLTSGTTWHAAAIVVRLHVRDLDQAASVHARALPTALRAEPGQSTGAPAGRADRARHGRRPPRGARRVAAFNRYCSVEVHGSGPDDVAKLFPPARVDDVLAGFHVPGRRPCEPRRRDDGPRPGRPDARGDDRRGRAGARPAHALRGRRAAGPGRADAARRRRGGGRRQLHRDVGAAIRRGGRRRPAAAGGGALLPDLDGVDGVTADLPVLEDPAA